MGVAVQRLGSLVGVGDVGGGIEIAGFVVDWGIGCGDLSC